MSDAQAAAGIATEAFLKVRAESNANFREGACTYVELKVAVNSAGYVMDEVRRLAGLEPWALAGEDGSPNPLAAHPIKDMSNG